MRSIGLDLGTKTLGVAISDPTGLIASSLKTITFENEDYDVLLPQIKQIITENKVQNVVLGFPKNMDNSLGPRALITLAFKEKLEQYLNQEVIMQDERRTSHEATHYLIEANVKRKNRKKVIDSVAATLILQGYLDKERMKKHE